jgi:hypothetical protein
VSSAGRHKRLQARARRTRCIRSEWREIANIIRALRARAVADGWLRALEHGD